METLGAYGSDDEATPSLKPEYRDYSMMAMVSAAPAVGMLSAGHVGSQLLRHDQKEISSNLPIEVLMAPVQGPANPFTFNSLGAEGGGRRVGMGVIEDAAVEDWTFDEQYQTYQRSGFAVDLTSNQVLGNYGEYLKSGGETAQTVRVKRPASDVKSNGGKRKREVDLLMSSVEDLGDEASGPWAAGLGEQARLGTLVLLQPQADAGATEEEEDTDKSATKEKENKVPSESKPEEKSAVAVSATDVEVETSNTVHIVEPDEEAEMWERKEENKLSFTLPPRPPRGALPPKATSTFHGAELFDYQGRSWTAPPSGVRPEPDFGAHDCFIPTKCIKKYVGHTKGVQAIEFSPLTGHLLLSASLDGKCKIWDVYEDRNVKRTFSGHTEAVRSINFSNDGSRFLSSGFDRYMRLWDVETGQPLATFSNRKMGYQVKFYPRDNNLFLMAASDHRIYQWDARAGTVVQEYNHHLEAVSTVTFFDDGRKFVSSSDDKKLLVWEFDIPVPILYVQEPGMQCMPYVALHPSGNALACQSMDNTITTYSCAEGRVKATKKKQFTGHVNSGYGCQLGFSPNGQFLISGDGQGKLNVWDWGSTKAYRKFHAHDSGPCVGAVWHPLRPSWVATCGWDGLIKLWQ